MTRPDSKGNVITALICLLHHEHDHDHSHDPYPGGHSHLHVSAAVPSERPTIWQLIASEFFGGIVLCPAALAVLLGVVSYGRYIRGLSLVIIFSVGMAIVLVAIEIMMVKAADYAGNYVVESAILGNTTRDILHMLLRFGCRIMRPRLAWCFT